MRFDLLERQIAAEPGKRAGLANIALALASWSGPFVGSELKDHWSRLSGRVVWLDQKRDYTPNQPLQNAMVFLKTQRGDKYLMGTRGVPAVLTNEEGRFHFDPPPGYVFLVVVPFGFLLLGKLTPRVAA